MANSHIGPDGPGKCSAKAGNCPFAPESDHFTTIKEAREVYAERLASTYDALEVAERKVYKLSAREQALREKNAEMAKNLISARAESEDHIFEDADPARAEKRLSEAIEYAKSRQNTALVSKLTSARVLPSGSFRRSGDGKRMSVDSALGVYQSVKHVESGRAEIEKALNAAIRRSGDDLTKEKFALKDESGSYSVTIKEGVDEDAFAQLPTRIRDAVSSDKTSMNIELARENLSPAKLKQITTSTHVADFVVGKPVGMDSAPKADSDFKAKSGDAAVEEGLQKLSSFYTSSRSEFGGTVSELKAKQNDYTGLMKDAAAKRDGNVFAPARSQWNGIVVSHRTSINPKLAAEILTEDEIKSISVTSKAPDREKAKTMLPPEVFAKIFAAKTASIRVTPSKS